jgi:hypothetical protein
LLELLRKKYVDETTVKNGGLGKYEDMMVSKDHGAIDRHTKQLIYRTVK